MPRVQGTDVAIVLAGGDPVDAAVRAYLPDDAFVVAADSGLHQADALGLPVDVVVGDLDSADAGAVAAAEAAGAIVERHPVEKDATDLELAFVVAQRHGARTIVVAGGGGGRVDHFLANVALLASPAFGALAVEAYTGAAHLRVARGGRGVVAIDGRAGDLVTLLPVGGEARGITTQGLEYPLTGEDLAPGTTRGVSNVVVATPASVSLAHGVLLVVRPTGGTQ